MYCLEISVHPDSEGLTPSVGSAPRGSSRHCAPAALQEVMALTVLLLAITQPSRSC